MQTMKQDSAAKVAANVLTIPQASRAYLVGQTGTGKSTLLEVLMKEYQLAYKDIGKAVRTLIIDTKPRFRAEYELNGFGTRLSKRYAKWGHGSGFIPGSIVLPRAGRYANELDQVFRLGYSTAIVQCEKEEEWSAGSEMARIFYERYSSHIPRLLIVDELADFYRFRSIGDIFQRVARNGRERNVAFIAGSQRPRKVPVEIMSEMSRLYMFRLDFMEDIKHVWEFGIPRGTMKPNGYSFYMYDRNLQLEPPSNEYYQLSLEAD
jgi:DNA helicase HerA-like ATPase